MQNLRILVLVFLISYFFYLPFQVNAQCVSDPVSNLVKNGNFNNGNTDFISGYSYCNTSNCLYPEGYYAVGRNANTYHGNFVGRDHTSGNGNFIIVNGAGVPSTIVWRQTISVKASTDYNFSSWVMSLVAGSPARLQFQINGVTIGSIFNAPSTINSWENFFVTWNSGANTSAVITILNQNTTLSGNDFGLDDISFLEICNTPVPNLGADKTLCGVGSIVLNTSIPHNTTTSVTWNDGTTGVGVSAPYTKTITAPGKYWVCVKDGPCVKTDTINISADFSIDLGPDFTLCAVSSFLLNASYASTSTTYKWYKNNSLIPDSTQKTFLVRSPGTYKVEVFDGTCGATRTDEVLVNSVSAIPNDGYYCPPGQATFSVTPNPTGGFKWYDQLTGGTLRGKGNSLNTASTGGNMIMYAEDTSAFIHHVGPQAKFAQGFAEKVSSGIYIEFDALESFTLNSVQVFANIYNPNETVQVGVTLKDNTGTIITSKVQTLKGPPIVPIGNVWPFTVPLGFNVPVGNGLRLTNDGTPALQDLFYASGAANVVTWSSYKVPGIIALKGLDPGHTFSSCLTTCYGFFYDWEIAKGNNCARIPVMSIPNCSLPLEFTGINAEAYDGYNLINWQTINEENVSYFLVQRSGDGKNFETIHSIKYGKDDEQSHSWNFKDYSFTGSTSYYRIVEISSNGTQSFSSVVSVNNNNLKIHITPNPTTGIFRLKVSTISEAKNYTISVHNSMGELIILKEAFDSTDEQLQLAGQPSGVYFITISNEIIKKMEKVVKY